MDMCTAQFRLVLAGVFGQVCGMASLITQFGSEAVDTHLNMLVLLMFWVLTHLGRYAKVIFSVLQPRNGYEFSASSD